MRRSDYNERMRRYHHHNRMHSKRDRMLFGSMIAVLGIVLLCKALGIFYLSVHTWPFLLIFLGIFVAIKSGFRNMGSVVLIVIGVANLVPAFYIMGHPSTELAWPLLLIGGGLFMALRPRRPHPYFDRRHRAECGDYRNNVFTSNENTINLDVTFGGRKEMVTSKDFKGGSVSATFGGVEINLMQADITEKDIVIDCKVSFGGVEIVVPSHWHIQNEVNPSFGSVEDERTIHTSAPNDDVKVLILRGTCTFGSIEIKSY